MDRIKTIIDDAIARFGSEAALARASGVSQPVVNEAKRTGRLGPKFALGLHKALDGDVPLHDLRPDIWEPPATTEAA